MSFNEIHHNHLLVGDETYQNGIFYPEKTATMNTAKGTWNRG